MKATGEVTTRIIKGSGAPYGFSEYIKAKVPEEDRGPMT